MAKVHPFHTHIHTDTMMGLPQNPAPQLRETRDIYAIFIYQPYTYTPIITVILFVVIWSNAKY